MKTKEEYKTEFLHFLYDRMDKNDGELRKLGNEILVKFDKVLSEIYQPTPTENSDKGVEMFVKKELKLRKYLHTPLPMWEEEIIQLVTDFANQHKVTDEEIFKEAQEQFRANLIVTMYPFLQGAKYVRDKLTNG
jgi:hypothetical protein